MRHVRQAHYEEWAAGQLGDAVGGPHRQPRRMVEAPLRGLEGGMNVNEPHNDNDTSISDSGDSGVQEHADIRLLGKLEFVSSFWMV